MDSIATKTCLIIEDQKASVRFIKDLMIQAFPQAPVEVAHDLKEAHLLLNARKSASNKKKIGLVFIDLGLPDGNGSDIIQIISEIEPEAIPIVMTIYDDDAFLFKALASGAKGYLLKEDDPEVLIDILRRIERGDPALSPAVARRILNSFKKEREPDKSGHCKLTPREHETLVLLARGFTIAEAAEQLGLRPRTVGGYVKIIYQKLHVSNRVALVQEATRRRLL